MDDIRQTAIDRFRAYLERRQFSAHTVASYTLDLRLFFAEVSVPLAQVSFREVDQFVERQHHLGRAWATINRRLNALKHFFAFCVEQQLTRESREAQSLCPARAPLPKALSREQVQRLFAQIAHPMDRALFLVILRCGPRVSEVADLKLEQIDWEQQAHIVQGKGAKIGACTCRLMLWPVSNSVWSSIQGRGRRAMSFGIANAPSSPCR